MLVLTRGKGDAVMIGDDICVTVEDVADTKALVAVVRKNGGAGVVGGDELIARQWLRLGSPIPVAQDISIEIVDIRERRIRLGINAPRTVSVHRREIYRVLAAKDGPNPGARQQAEMREKVSRELHDRIAVALLQKFEEAARPLIAEVRQNSDPDTLRKIAHGIASAETLEDVRRIWTS